MTTSCASYKLLILIILLSLLSCKKDKKKIEEPKVKISPVLSLDSLKQTAFVATLENPIKEKKNIIYAPSLLYAWDKVREKLLSPILLTGSNSLDFKLFNASESHQNALRDSEYSATVKVIDNEISAKAIFTKKLPFEMKMQELDHAINFEGVEVAAFGMKYYDENLLKMLEILYYEDDSNFILKLKPKDEQQEIILVKGLDNYPTLAQAMKRTNALIAEGEKQRTQTELSWKYQFVPKDIFEIPKIEFNIDTHYPGIEGQSFSTKNKQRYSIIEAYQRTDFTLNERGAEVESEAFLTAAADSGAPKPIVTHPKKLIFDSPFLIILKRVEAPNPYFVMKVANSELLIISKYSQVQ